MTGQHPATRVTMYPDGPLIVRGDFVVCTPDGEPVPTGPIVALCRCGRSALKPLCDGSHRTSPERRRQRTESHPAGRQS
jgi:CDGSH-type Zn-finger protein